MMLTDAGSEEPLLCPYHSWNTTTTFHKLSMSYSHDDGSPLSSRL